MRGLNAQTGHEGELTRYPGSPLLARRLMREADHLVLNELHPEDNVALRKLFGHDPQTKVLELDGWTALKSLLPPKERRGVVLVDPAYEQPGELERLVQGLKETERRFATGTILLWYPIKDATAIAQLRRQVAGLELPKALAVELMIRAADDPERLNGAGLIVVNPPFTLAAKLALAAAGAGTPPGPRAGGGLPHRGAGPRGRSGRETACVNSLARGFSCPDTLSCSGRRPPGGDVAK